MSKAKAKNTARPLAPRDSMTDDDVEAVHPDTEYATVRSTLPMQKDGGSPVALWEVDDQHPGGEVMVAGRTPVRVALTPQVTALIRDGVLEEGDFEPGVIPEEE